MTDDRSDLRSQLIEALKKDCQSHPCIDKVHQADADRVLPLIEAHMAVLEARADRAEQLLTDLAIASHDPETGPDFDEAVDAILDWYTEAVRQAVTE